MDAQPDGVKYRCGFPTGCETVSSSSDDAGANMINMLLLCILAATFEKEFKELLNLPSLRARKKRLVSLIMQYQDGANKKVVVSHRGSMLHVFGREDMVQNPMVFGECQESENRKRTERKSELQVRIEEVML